MSEKIKNKEAHGLNLSESSFSIEQEAEKWFQFELEPVLKKNKKLKVSEDQKLVSQNTNFDFEIKETKATGRQSSRDLDRLDGS